MKIRMSHFSVLAAALTVAALSFDSVLADSPVKPLPTTQKALSGTAASPAVRAQPAAALKTQGAAGGPSATNVIQGPVLANCAAGFNKTAEHKNAQTTALYSFECTTPVITCPHNPALPLSSLDVQIINTNPEQSAKRIRYTCTYNPAIP